MTRFSLPIQIRWSDMDQNRHLRHSAYYDFGALVRTRFLTSHGLTTEKMEELRIGPILFREEAQFKKEIRMEDQLEVDVELVRTRHDYSRWSLRHNFYKDKGALAAIINMDGAWLDLTKRKLVIPPDFIIQVFGQIPLAPDFQTTVVDNK